MGQAWALPGGADALPGAMEEQRAVKWVWPRQQLSPHLQEGKEEPDARRKMPGEELG